MNRLLLLLVLAPLAGCVTHSESWSEAYAQYVAGDLERAERGFSNASETGSTFLSGAEAGMVAWTAGRNEDALAHLHDAAQASREIEDRALLSPENVGDQLVTLFVTERAGAYPGEGYERVQVHALLALAYLGVGAFEDAQVEMRLADALLASEEELYDAQYAAGGLGNFLSAILYELSGKPDEAWIDYRRMLEKGVGEPLAGRAMVRLAPQLDREEDVRALVRKYGAPERMPEGAASVVLVAGVGEAPRKVETAISLPLPDGYVHWAVPTYVAVPQPVSALRLDVPSSHASVRTTVVEDITKVAKKNLDDRLAWLAARSAVRAYLGYALSRELSRQFGGVGWIAGAILTQVAQQADLRSWMTLPGSWQAARLFLPPGRHALAVAAEGGGRVELGTWELVPGETLFIYARALGPHLWVHPIGGERLPDEQSPSPAAALPREAELVTMGAP